VEANRRYWDFRVIWREHKSDLAYGIHRVYYEPDGTIFSVSEDPVEPFGESLAELEAELAMMAEAFTKELLCWDELPRKRPSAATRTAMALAVTIGREIR
jgi:hypothetical protein